MPRTLASFFLIVLALNTGWFVVYSASLGWRGLTEADPSEVSRVFFRDAPVATVSLALHMLVGAVLTIGAPLQALPVLRRKWPGVHRRAGYVLFVLALITGVAGAIYIALQGTIGGWWMSLWFAIYGGLIVLSAAQTVYYAIDKDFARHFEWATRLIVLAVGSWIFRMHYAIWFALTDGAGSNDAFTGLFDRVQVFAFFVPYLLITEAALRLRRARREGFRRAVRAEGSRS
jgi:hypothetical protein